VGIIALVPDEWDDPVKTARHHVISRLSRHFSVVWVDPSRPWREYVRIPSLRARHRARCATPAGLSVLRASFTRPSIYRPSWLRKSIERSRLAAARALLEAEGVRRIIVYLWRPEYAASLKLLRHDLSCYHIDDEYSFSQEETGIDPAEADLIRRVDLVFMHSQALLEKKGHLNQRTVLIPNGVDFAAFSSPHPEPADLARIPRPRIGYVGVIKQQLDLPLVLELVRKRPNLRFVFVGPIGFIGNERHALDALMSQPNCHFLGARPIETLPAYLQHLDIGLLPYKLNAYTKYIYPLKLHEYLAAGLPVVASPIAPLKPFASVITLASSASEWSEAIDRQLAGSTKPSNAVHLRRSTAEAHDWERLVERLALAVRGRLSDQPGISSVAR
jgi:glycosyltransferase involved in cell wall biosynthesis